MRIAPLLALLAAVTFAGTVTHEVAIAPSDIALAEVEGYTVVSVDAVLPGIVPVRTTEPGTPLLPVLLGNVLIPAGAEVTGVAVTELATVELGQGFRLYPVQPMRPLSRFNDVAFVPPRADVYSSDSPFPPARSQAVPAGSKAGYRIAGFEYCPFQYRPASGRLTLVTKALVSVSYREAALPVTALSESQRSLLDGDVERLVVNPRDVAVMAPPAVERDAAEIDVAILTSSTLAPSMGSFQDWLESKGYFAAVVRIDTISNPGSDTPEKMRNFLKQKFADNGLKYVILAGDVQHVPCRYGYFDYYDADVPVDLYFSDLDGDWDANGNNQYGEMTGDSVDLYADIYVGRLPFDDAADIANFLAKDTLYEVHPDTGYLNNVILPSEELWSWIYFTGQFVNTNIARALSAYQTWQVDSGLYMSSSQVINGINAGRHLFHFAGHGAYDAFGSTFSTSNISSLTNATTPFIVNSMACDCGSFDGSPDCIAEEFVNAVGKGAVSATLNSRYGWGAPPCMGPSEQLCMEFYNNYVAGMTQGRACGLAKDFVRNAGITQFSYRWSIYDWTLQGDPTMMMWRRPPVVPAVVHPDTIAAMPQAVIIQVDCGESALRGARCAISHLGELLGRATTSSSGYASVPLPAVEDGWTLTLTVTGQDIQPYRAEIATTAGGAAPLVVYDHGRVDDPNGRLDPGEESDVWLVVGNRGTASADDARGYLSTLSPWVAVIDSEAHYGTIAAGDTAAGDAFRVQVDRRCPQGHVVELTLRTVSADGEWYSGLELTAGLEYARGGLWATHDTGDYVLAVCANGGVGTTQYHGEGFGFIYPTDRLWSSSALMHGGLVIGTDTGWVCDNFYGTPWQQTCLDFAMQESLRIVYPPDFGDEEYVCRFDDSNHPDPKQVDIVQRSFGSGDPDHEDFVIIEYRLFNNGADPLSGLYVGVACDFRTPGWNENDETDYAGTDSMRNLAYIRSHSSGETLALGIRHIYPVGAGGFANCPRHTTYVQDGFTKAEKMGFLDGTLRQTTGASAANWHAMSSSGPYTIPAGDSQIVAFVILGSRTVAELLVHSDTAALWYEPVSGIAGPGPAAPMQRFVSVEPGLFTDRVTVRYALEGAEPIDVRLYDAAGREWERFSVSPEAATGRFTWRPAVAPGVYFLAVSTGSGPGFAGKLVRVR